MDLTIQNKRIPFIDDPTVVGKWRNLGSWEPGSVFSPDQVDPDRGDLPAEVYFLPHGEGYYIFEGWTQGQVFLHHGGDEPILEVPYTHVQLDGQAYLLLSGAGADGRTSVLRQEDNNAYTWSALGRRDDIQRAFVEDPAVVGQWKVVGYVVRKEDYPAHNLGEEGVGLSLLKFYPDGRLDQLYLDPSLEGGRQWWHDRWTKGCVLMQGMRTAPAYELCTVDGQELLFLEWKTGNYIFGGQDPEYFVFTRA